MARTKISQYHCPRSWTIRSDDGLQVWQQCSGRVNVEESDRFAAFTQISCDFPQRTRDDGSSGRFAVLCPECQTEMRKGRTISGSAGSSACESLCATATSSRCTCSCGGMRHGVSA